MSLLEQFLKMFTDNGSHSLIMCTHKFVREIGV